MRYEAHAVEGAAMPRFREKPDISDVEYEIGAIYTMAANLGGRIVGGHTLTCDTLVEGSDGQQVPTRIDHLFLVLELPDRSTDDPGDVESASPAI
jgi:hypothetical protein